MTYFRSMISHWLFLTTLLASPLTVFAEDPAMTIIQGRFTTERVPEDVTLNYVKNGEPVLHSKTKVAKDGTFGFCFTPESSGLYTIGERGDAARLYLTAGRSVRLVMEGAGFSVNAEDRENSLLAQWSKKIHALKKHNQLQGTATYEDVFPTLPELEQTTAATIAAGQSGNVAFDSLFAKLVAAEFEYELYHFLFMPRTKHPKPADYPAIYQKISSAPRFTDDSALAFDFGMAYASTYLMFQYATKQEEWKNVSDPMAEICVKSISNQTVRGWYLAKNVLTRAKAYDAAYTAKLEKYRSALVTDEQKKYVADFVMTINKTGTGEPASPFEGVTPDGKNVKLSDFKGKVVVVDVWATWCGPCRAQAPHWQKLEEEMKGNDVVFVSYSLDEPKDIKKWKTAVAAENSGGIHLIGPAAFKSPICEIYKITAIPRFMVFDKLGRIVTIDAPRPSTPELKALIEKHLR